MLVFWGVVIGSDICIRSLHNSFCLQKTLQYLILKKTDTVPLACICLYLDAANWFVLKCVNVRADHPNKQIRQWKRSQWEKKHLGFWGDSWSTLISGPWLFQDFQWAYPPPTRRAGTWKSPYWKEKQWVSLDIQTPMRRYLDPQKIPKTPNHQPQEMWRDSRIYSCKPPFLGFSR